MADDFKTDFSDGLKEVDALLKDQRQSFDFLRDGSKPKDGIKPENDKERLQQTKLEVEPGLNQENEKEQEIDRIQEISAQTDEADAELQALRQQDAGQEEDFKEITSRQQGDKIIIETVEYKKKSGDELEQPKGALGVLKGLMNKLMKFLFGVDKSEFKEVNRYTTIEPLVKVDNGGQVNDEPEKAKDGQDKDKSQENEKEAQAAQGKGRGAKFSAGQLADVDLSQPFKSGLEGYNPGKQQARSSGMER